MSDFKTRSPRTAFRHRLLMAAAVVVLLPACATRKVCDHAQPHLDAQLMPALTVPEGVAVPDQVERLRIPAEPERRVPPRIEEQTDAGKTQVRCLQDPPRLPAARS